MTKELREENDLSLEDWLSMTERQLNERLIGTYCFPSDAHRLEYIGSVESRSEREVKDLLRRFLIPSGSLGCDHYRTHFVVQNIKNRGNDYSEHDARLYKFIRSKGKAAPPWEGITWIIDLLPNFPHGALQALDHYFSVHCGSMPDGRLSGMDDALEIIRAKYIGTPSSNNEKIAFLNQLNPRQFECIVASLYNEMGYDVTLTPASCDGGKDVVARRFVKGSQEHILVECKRHSKNIGVSIARALMGVVEHERANKGVLVSTLGFSKGVQELAKQTHRLELIDGPNLYCLLNRYLGPRWVFRIESIAREASARERP